MRDNILFVLAVGLLLFATTGAANAGYMTNSAASSYNFSNNDGYLIGMDSGSGVLSASYSTNTFYADVAARANGTSLGIYGRASSWGNNANIGYEFGVSAGFTDVVTFSGSGILNIGYRLEGLRWVNQLGNLTIMDTGVEVSLRAVDGTDYRDWSSFVYPPTWILPNGPTGFENPPPWVDNTSWYITDDDEPLFVVNSGKSYKFTVLLGSDLFLGGSSINGGPIRISPWDYNVLAGFDFLNTFTISDMYLTDENMMKIPFEITSSSGFTYPTSGPAPVPEPATMLLLGSGVIGLAGYRRKFKK